ncbi:redoxin domain-containing protein [Pontibacter qinzhouensis]|uniref:Redoxin domain-containing protein n=1 Tax=Pontibacter qinzhouensis TaxID=2603253 RepID=A0A5C8KAE8_9BACT|nr:redoxin domain-containing protein [Pontibacter qinzhouensis]TXK49237.1 redoxin domain-containing protein [Pontibacter qinzhouensis]
MALQFGDIAPDFTAETSLGTINFYEWLGESWGVLFSHVTSFAPVYTNAPGKTVNLKDEFEKRNIKMVALSTDPLDSHQYWIQGKYMTQEMEITYPVIADPDQKVAQLYGIAPHNSPGKLPVRLLYIIGPDKKVRHTITSPASVGGCFNELLQ